MSKEEKKVMLTYAQATHHDESLVRQVAADPEHWGEAFAEACKAWVEANPEKEALPRLLHDIRALRLFRLGEVDGAYACGSACTGQAEYCRKLGISQEVVTGVAQGNYDEELGLTEIIRLLGEL